MTDEELWQFLRLEIRPASPWDDARRQYPYDSSRCDGLSEDPADAPGFGGRELVDWMKWAISSAEVSPDGRITPNHAPVYLCRILYLLQYHHKDPNGNSAVKKETLSGAFYGGLAYSGDSLTSFDPSIFDSTLETWRGVYFVVEEWRFEGPDWAAMLPYVYLTDAGRKLVESGLSALSESQLTRAKAIGQSGQGDNERDKNKKTSSRKDRPLNDVARACARAYLMARTNGESVSLKRFCQDWVAKNGRSYPKPSGGTRSWRTIYRDLKGRPEVQVPTNSSDGAGDKGGDKPV